jgi:hypothetical protein
VIVRNRLFTIRLVQGRDFTRFFPYETSQHAGIILSLTLNALD